MKYEPVQKSVVVPADETDIIPEGSFVRAISKADGDRILAGIASVELRDREGDIILGSALKASLDDLFAFADGMEGALSYQHIDILPGVILRSWGPYKTEVRPLTKQDFSDFPQLGANGAKVGDEALMLVARIRKGPAFAEKIWQDVLAGKLQCLSISGMATKSEKGMVCEGFECKMVNRISGLSISATTLCERGQNPGAFVKIVSKSSEAAPLVIRKAEDCGCDVAKGLPAVGQSAIKPEALILKPDDEKCPKCGELVAKCGCGSVAKAGDLSRQHDAAQATLRATADAKGAQEAPANAAHLAETSAVRGFKNEAQKPLKAPKAKIPELPGPKLAKMARDLELFAIANDLAAFTAKMEAGISKAPAPAGRVATARTNAEHAGLDADAAEARAHERADRKPGKRPLSAGGDIHPPTAAAQRAAHLLNAPAISKESA